MDSVPKEVASPTEIVTTKGNEQKLVSQVAVNVRQLGHEDHTEVDVTPQTAQTPLPQSPDLKIVNAEHIGEEPNVFQKAAEGFLSVATDPFDAMTGKSKVGESPSSEWLETRLGKDQKKLQPGQTIALVDQKKAA